MSKQQKNQYSTITLLVLLLVFGSIFIFITSAFGHSDNLSDKKGSSENTFLALACISWWSHDAVGYHPSMYIMLENISNHDLIGEEIPFQARFTDLHDGSITVARDYRRPPIHRHDRFALLLRAPKTFELPIDSSIWPPMECKALCKLTSQSGSEPIVENLYTMRLTQITLSDEDAHRQLISQAELNPLISQRERISVSENQDQNNSEKPAKTAIKDEKTLTPVEVKQPSEKPPKHLPKIGDDFYTFEQFFGKAKEFQAADTNDTDDLTWAHYRPDPPLIDAYAGSHGNGKVDVEIITLSSRAIPKEKDLFSLCKLIAGCKSDATVTPFAHSVRYLPSGRSEIMTTVIRDRKIMCFRIQGSDQEQEVRTVVFITRLAGDAENSLNNFIKKVSFLHL